MPLGSALHFFLKKIPFLGVDFNVESCIPPLDELPWENA